MYAKPFDSLEVFDVVGNQDVSLCQGSGGNEQVKVIDRFALAPQLDSQAGIFFKSCRNRDDAEMLADKADFLQLFGAASLESADIQLRQRDLGDAAIVEFSTEDAFLHTLVALEHIDQDIRVQ